jgi:hypothetical protein
MQTSSLPTLLTAQDVGLWLALPTGTVARLARQGKIPCLTLPSGDLVFDPAELKEWLQTLRNAKADAPEGPNV